MGDVTAQQRVDAIQELWTDGDYAAVGDGFRIVAQRLVDEHVQPGTRVLDAATGTGNLAVAAARAGAQVDAFDLTPALLDQARERAAAAGVDVRFVEGDLLDVPFPDASFDLVGSTFGAFLADDPARCAHELVRVTRPGGRVVATAWALGSIFVAMAAVMHAADPRVVPHTGVSPWAEPDALATLVHGLPVDVAVGEQHLWLPFPSADVALAFYERTSGPVRRYAAAIGDERWSAVRTTVVGRWSAAARATDDGVELPATYATATLVRRR